MDVVSLFTHRLAPTGALRPNGHLTAQQERFCQEYLIDTIGAAAARRAGYSARRSNVTAAELLERPAVKARIEELQADRVERTKITQDRVLEELAYVAFSRLDEAATWDENGLTLMPSSDVPDSAMAAIISVKERRKVIHRKKEDPIETIEKEVKLHPKLPALAKLAKHVGLDFSPKGALVGSPENPFAIVVREE